MPEQMRPLDGDQAELGTTRYAVVLGARLDPSWSSWFEGLQLQPTRDGHTLLVGSIPDQAALHGLLACIRDLGIDLVSLSRLDDD